MKNRISLVLLFFMITLNALTQKKPDAIVGKWMSTDDNLEVEVFKQKNDFKASVLWFDDTDDPKNPMRTRLDEKNHNKVLRNRRIIGLEVLRNLQYNAEDDEWQDGIIYDSSSGKEWDAKAWINKAGILKVRGYWHFPILGQNISFKRVK